MTRHHPRGIPTVVIVGGGVSGATVALFLSRFAPGAARIVVVEPRAQIGPIVAPPRTMTAPRIGFCGRSEP